MTAEISPRSCVRGRPRTAGGFTCDRCSRAAGKHRASWPEGRICGTCFTVAMRTHGPAPAAEQSACSPAGLLPTMTSRSASIAPASPRTTTAPAAARKPSTTARTPAPAAHSGTTSRRCCASTSPRDRKRRQAARRALPSRPRKHPHLVRNTGVRELLERDRIPLSHEALDRNPTACGWNTCAACSPTTSYSRSGPLPRPL
jgi:hypothetical protein